jgi:Novel STAND NTPase 1
MEGWRRPIEWSSGILALASLVKELKERSEQLHGSLLEQLRHFATSPTANLAVVVFFGLVWATARFPQMRTKLVRLILGPPKLPAEMPLLFRGPQAYGAGEHLPGRQAEGEACWLLLQQSPFLFLEGESGCGKSSLVNAVLLPRAQESFRTVLIRVGDNPFGNTIQALNRLVGDSSDWPANSEGLSKAISAVTGRGNAGRLLSDKTKPLLVCIDQFEEFFGGVHNRERRDFFECLRKAIEAGQLRLLLVIRIDFSDLLVNLCREVDPKGTILNLGNFYALEPFRRTQALRVVRDIFSPLVAANTQLEGELSLFGEALVDDLLQPPRDARLARDDEKTVLPAELQMVGVMIESLGPPNFTASSFRKYGGRNGLLNAYIRQAKVYVSRKTSVPGEEALLILRELIPQTKTKTAQSPQAISDALGLPISRVTQVLEAFADKKLVNRLPTETGSRGDPDMSGPVYELMHEHLAQILKEAQEPTLRKAQESEERLHFWYERTRSSDQPSGSPDAYDIWDSLRTAFAQPVPLAEIMRLWRFARSPSDRRMLLRSVKGFSLKVAVVVIPVTCFGLWILTDAYQVRAMVRENRFVDPAETLWALGTLDEWIELLAKSGYLTQAKAEVERALEAASGGETGDKIATQKIASVFLNARKAELLSIDGHHEGVEKSLAIASDALGDVSSRTYASGSYLDGAIFQAAARLAEARANLGETERSVAAWRSAFERVKGWGPYTTNEQVFQFIGAARGLRGHPISIERGLWDDAVEAVRNSFGPPYNCQVLSTLAAELYKQGDVKKGDALWAEVGEAVEQFSSFAPRIVPAVRQSQGRPRSNSVSAPEDPGITFKRTKHGMRTELGYDSRDDRYERAIGFLGIGIQMHGVGKTEEAKRIWEKSLAEGRKAWSPVGNAPSKAQAPLPPPPPSSPQTFGLEDGRLYIYEMAAENFYRLHLFDLEMEAERAIVDLARAKIGSPFARATTLTRSAGRLYSRDVRESDRIWHEALASARELKDAGDGEGEIGQRRSVPESFPVVTQREQQNEQFGQVQSALSGTRTSWVRSVVLRAAAGMFLRRGNVEAAVQAARAIVDEQERRTVLFNAAQYLIREKDVRGAKRIVSELSEEAQSIRDQLRLSSQLASVATLQAELGLFRQSRVTCEGCMSFEKLRNSTNILWLYETDARKNQRLREMREERSSRYRLDWAYIDDI